jgi:hypothetical protein
MMHLYDRNDDPPPFPAPRGFVRATICATTGRAPSPHARCPGIVTEWVPPRELAAVERPAPNAGLRILFPHDGDVFVRDAAAGELARSEEQLALRAVDAGAAVRWSVDGAPLALDANGNAYWPLRLGTWRIDAQDGRQSATVTIRVVPPPQRAQPGFTRQ